MNRKQLEEKLLKWYLDNPSLTNDVDYLPDSEREVVYQEAIECLSDSELVYEISLIEGEYDEN